jgi:uncharacterized protein (TIGR04222 family)
VAKDPYQIAFLRAGKAEVIRVATVSLINRGLLKADGPNLETQHFKVSDESQRPLDKAILTTLLKEKNANVIFSDKIIAAEASAAGEALKELKLLPSGGTNFQRFILWVLAVGFLWLIAGVKIQVALSRGRTNIGFLIILSVVVPIIFGFMIGRKRTLFGNRILTHLNGMFSKLSKRSASFALGDTPTELTYLAAIYGMTALPMALSEVVAPLRIQPVPSSGSGMSGSACGGGSSCGGGGGGGGCGGCGG